MPTSNPSDFEDEASALVEQMTLEEKASLCSGSGFWHLQAIDRLGLPRLCISDGPHGLRRQLEGSDHLGLGGSIPATCFPAGVSLAASWDTALCYEMAQRLAKECIAAGVAVVLGPGVNMKRNPLCGRNFEYYSEDPYLAGELACAFVQGAQSEGVGTSIKHFAANNQEFSRLRVDTIVDERTLREIYLPAFERAIKGAQPWTVMSAYNRLNGMYCGESSWLLHKVLREEWGFKGLVVSDWGGTNDRVAGVKHGLDIEMPSSGGINDARIVAAVQEGRLRVIDLDRACHRVVSFMRACSDNIESPKSSEVRASANTALLDDNHAFARRAAMESAVLLKNESNVLPLLPTGTIAVIGSMAQTPRFQGAGSSRINAYMVEEPLAAIREYVLAAGRGGTVTYTEGYNASAVDDAAAIAAAVEAARSATAAVLFVGLPSAYEAEGIDRAHMEIPGQMNRLIHAVGVANPNAAVVLMGGAPMNLPTCGFVPSILYVGLCGQAAGGAIAHLLFGAVSPSGKLAETWPMHLEDCPSHANFGNHPRQVVYREGLNVGYRYFVTARVPTQFPFGHGLTYSRFTYSELQLSASSITASQTLIVTVDVKNEGDVPAAEIVQLYVRDVEACVYRPDRELKGFAKVHVDPGKTQKVTFQLDERAFAFFDTEAGDWYAESGIFEVLVGASSEDIRQRASVRLTNCNERGYVGGSEAPRVYVTLDDAGLAKLGLLVPEPEPLLPIDVNTTFEEISETGCFAWCFVQTLVAATKLIAKRGFAEGLGEPEAAVVMMVGCLRGSSLRSWQLMSSGMMNDRTVQALVHLFNGHALSAFLRIIGCKR